MAQSDDLLAMLASETSRRSQTLIGGVQELARADDPDSALVESLRVEAHGLKGAALVVHQVRLAELAQRIETALTASREEGLIDVDLAARLVAASSALHEGAQAAAEGTTEPPTVSEALASLGD